MAQLLSNLPIGAKVKFGKHSINGETAQDIIWLVVAKNHSSTPAYPIDSVTLLTEKIIDLRAEDAIEPDNPIASRGVGGNNDYSVSNIDQWLNKDGSIWYTPQHTYDQSPNNIYTIQGTGYENRPGFLSNFTPDERNAILNTNIRVAIYDDTTTDIVRKVYLPSAPELGLSVGGTLSEGARWEYFIEGDNRKVGVTTQCFNNTLSYTKPSTLGSKYEYLLRTPKSFNPSTVYCVATNGGLHEGDSFNGRYGVRPACNLLSTLSISDTVDSEGCYTFVWNSAPDAPSIIAAPPTVYGGKPNPISWTAASDPNGDAVTYHLECSIDNGAYAEIYSGSALTYAHLVPFGATFVVYRVKATDPSGESSAYTVSATKTVVNNNAPVISGTDSNLGVKSAGFTGSYTITDADSNTVTVTEAIDGVQIRALVATLNTAIPYSISGNTWLTLPNGSHTFTITATDGTDTTVRTYVFTKMVERFTIRNSTPWVASTRPSRIMVLVTRNIPSGARFKVEVCNNGLQGSPTWEDCTAAVESGLVHVFSNQSNSAASWGVLVRVTVERNGAAGACYVSAIGGNFE